MKWNEKTSRISIEILTRKHTSYAGVYLKFLCATHCSLGALMTDRRREEECAQAVGSWRSPCCFQQLVGWPCGTCVCRIHFFQVFYFVCSPLSRSQSSLSFLYVFPQYGALNVFPTAIIVLIFVPETEFHLKRSHWADCVPDFRFSEGCFSVCVLGTQFL